MDINSAFGRMLAPTDDAPLDQIYCASICWHVDEDRILGGIGKAEKLLGRSLAGRNLSDAVGQQNAHAIRNVISQAPHGIRYINKPLTLDSQDFEVSVEMRQDACIVTFETPTHAGSFELSFENLEQLIEVAETESQIGSGSNCVLKVLQEAVQYDVVAHVVRRDRCVEVLGQSVTGGGKELPQTLDTQVFEDRKGSAVRIVSDSLAQSFTEHPDNIFVPSHSPPTFHERQVMSLALARSMMAIPVSYGESNLETHWILCLNRKPRLPSIDARRILLQFARHFGGQLALARETERRARWYSCSDLVRNAVPKTLKPGQNWKPEQQTLQRLADVLEVDGLSCLIEGQWNHYGDMDFDANKLIFQRNAPPEGDVLASMSPTFDAPDIVALFETPPEAILITASPQVILFAYRKSGNSSLSLDWEPWKVDLFRQVHTKIWETQNRQQFLKTMQRQKLLIHELNHRVRNILAIIRSLINQTADSKKTIEEYTVALAGRIEAISKTHDLIVGTFKGSASVKRIITNEVEAFASGPHRVLIEGDDAALPADKAVAFALVVHELMTNASKYGALSNPTGQVHVGLTQSEAGISIAWSERGGPALPPERSAGFGTKLISSIVPVQLNGHLAMDFAPGGLLANLSLPMLGGAISDDPEPPVRSIIAQNRQFDTQEKDTSESKNRMKCLLVEDEILVAMDSTSVIENEIDCDCVIATNEATAQEMLSDERIDFAVLDVNLGSAGNSGRIGMELIRRNIPFVFLSGYGANAELPPTFREFPRLGKPLKSGAISEQLQHWFAERPAAE